MSCHDRENPQLCGSRLALVMASKIVLKNSRAYWSKRTNTHVGGHF